MAIRALDAAGFGVALAETRPRLYARASVPHTVPWFPRRREAPEKETPTHEAALPFPDGRSNGRVLITGERKRAAAEIANAPHTRLEGALVPASFASSLVTKTQSILPVGSRFSSFVGQNLASVLSVKVIACPCRSTALSLTAALSGIVCTT